MSVLGRFQIFSWGVRPGFRVERILVRRVGGVGVDGLGRGDVSGVYVCVCVCVCF